MITLPQIQRVDSFTLTGTPITGEVWTLSITAGNETLSVSYTYNTNTGATGIAEKFKENWDANNSNRLKILSSMFLLTK